MSDCGGGDDPEALGQGSFCGLVTEVPAEGADIILGHGGEVQQHDAEAQLAVQLRVIGIGAADQKQLSVPEQEAVSLSV